MRGETKPDQSLALPPGVKLMQLKTHPDERGELTEIFRNEWHESPLPMQWATCRSAANVLRGVHAHARHWDYLCVVSGEVFVGLHDLRPDRPEARCSAVLPLDGRRLQMLLIPPAVAHGFYSASEATILIGASQYYDPSDHNRCHWNAPELRVAWPCTTPELSALDREAGGYADFRAAVLGARGS